MELYQTYLNKSVPSHCVFHLYLLPRVFFAKGPMLNLYFKVNGRNVYRKVDVVVEDVLNTFPSFTVGDKTFTTTKIDVLNAIEALRWFSGYKEEKKKARIQQLREKNKRKGRR